MGEALTDALDSDDRALLLDAAARWPLLRVTLQMVEMVLAKARPEIAAVYQELLAPAELQELGDELSQRLERTTAAVLETLGQERLLTSNPVLRRSISVRNPYVDPINLLQATLLRRLRDREDSGLEEAVVLTMNGIAAGMRNTG